MPEPTNGPRPSIHPTPEYRYADVDGDVIHVEAVDGRPYNDCRHGHVSVTVLDLDGGIGVVHIPPAEAHVLAAAILAHAYPHLTALSVDLDDYRISEQKD